MSKIVHFDIPADDVERAKGFYGELFGWKFEDAAVPGMEYWLIHTEEGGIDGGMARRMIPEQRPINYISVESIDASMQKVQKLGGQVTMGKTPVPGIGWSAFCVDTEGNPFGLWQDDPQAK